MYLEFFQFKQEPFSISPDPRFLFMSEQHREALAHLLYGIQSSGAFVVLSGEVGSGKTTVCRCFLDQVPENVDIAFILNPKLSADELLASICDELKISYPENPSIKVLVDKLNHFLLENHAKGRDTLVIIEEAQNLSEDVLEQLRLLTNLETSERKLLQIVLLAQPEFLEILQKPEMKQFAQRVTARFHLSPLNFEETQQYIQHRLSVAGAKHDPFPDAIKKGIYQQSKGVPRVINLLADRCLLGAYSRGLHTVSRDIFRQAVRELEGKPPSHHVMLKLALGFGSIVLVLGLIFLATYWWTGHSKNELAKDPALANIYPDESRMEVDLNIRSSYPGAAEQLLNLWGLSSNNAYIINNNKNLCDLAAVYKLQCYSDRANLGLLLKLGRPVILKITSDGENHNFVVLLGRDGEQLLLQFADQVRKLSFQQLEKLWLGDFIALVKTPESWQGAVLSQGEQSALTYWLHEKLEQLGYSPRGQDGLYTAEQVLTVKELQTKAGIYADGKLGLKTIIFINSLTDPSVPKLRGVDLKMEGG